MSKKRHLDPSWHASAWLCTLAGGCLFFLKDFHVAPLGEMFNYRPVENIQTLNGRPVGGDHSGTPETAAFLVRLGNLSR